MNARGIDSPARSMAFFRYANLRLLFVPRDRSWFGVKSF